MIHSNKPTVYLRTACFSEEEQKNILKARAIKGVDKPSFYHNAIMDYTEKVLSEAKKEAWIVFFLNGKEIGGYTVRGTFRGEIEETKGMLASENGCKADDIETREVMR